MKKTVFYISVAALALASLAACQKNGPKQFPESEAFVAFNSPEVTFAEAVAALPSETTEENLGFLPQTVSLKVPVTLASIKGIEETVKFTVKEDDYMYKDYKDPEGDLEDESNWIERTAHSGVNFNLLTTSGTLSFDAEHRTRYIEFEILYNPEYTKDMKFEILLTKPESVALGTNSKCVVTISDVNHPLTDLLGSYTATGNDLWDGPSSWEMTLVKDENDDHLVWIINIFNNAGWAILRTSPYGRVDDDLSTITIEMGQKTQYQYSNGEYLVILGIDADQNSVESGNTTVTIVKNEDGKVIGLDFGPDYGFAGYIPNAGSVGVVLPQITAVKN